MAYRLTRRAEQDVLRIWQQIATDNEPAADRLVERLVHHFRLIAANLFLGRRRSDLREGLRTFPVGEYLIVYRIEEQEALILHVLHGRRDLQSILSS